MKIGIFGGTFDPVHVGHQNLVNNLLDRFPLDKLILVPAYVSPFKTTKPPIASIKDREMMLRFAFEGNEKIEVSRIELEKGGISYTVDTLTLLREMYPKDELFLCLTKETFNSLSSWKDPDRIKELATIVVAVKEGETLKDCQTVEIPWIEISSRALRKDFLNQKELKKYLSPKVLDYIHKHHLYCSVI